MSLTTSFLNRCPEVHRQPRRRHRLRVVAVDVEDQCPDACDVGAVLALDLEYSGAVR